MGGFASVIVGRDYELRVLRDALHTARTGHGRAVFIVGEGGIGKSRLVDAVAELAYAADMRQLRGRGSVMGPVVPFRPLTEALLSLLRSGVPIDVATLGPYQPLLAQLVPDWAQTPAPPPDGGSVVILAEAVLRLTELAGQDHGCLLALDDLQDADAETLAVVEYLFDNLDRQPTLMLGTLRDDPCPALRLAEAAGQRSAGTLMALDRLSRADSRRLAAACLDIEPDGLPEPAVDLLWAGAAGNPLRIKELLNGMVDSGFLIQDGSAWAVADERAASLPTTFTRGVARRFERLEPRAKHVLSVAAVLGRRFPLAVVQAVTGLEYRDLLSHLHGHLAGQLVHADDQTPDWYTFQHSLITEALLTLLDPAERADLARRAADAIEDTYPGLPGEWCQICAALRLDAGQPTTAGRLFAEAGKRALDQGAAYTAIAALDRAWQLLTHDVPARLDTLETRLYALAEARLVDRALAAVDLMEDIGASLDPHRRARIHIRLAWVANLDGRTAQGLHQLEEARALLGQDAPAEYTVPLDVVAAYLELGSPGPDQLNKAEEIARRTAAAAEAEPFPIAACQAWQLLGALVRTRDPDEATACLNRSRVIAIRHDLPIWEIHALVRLGMDDALRTGSLDRIEQARQQASRIGAVTARYQAEVNLALQLILRGEFSPAERLINHVHSAAKRLKLVEITQLMLVLRAVLAGHRGRRADMAHALAELDDRHGDLAQHRPRIHGLAEAFCALLEEDRALARRELATALRAEEANPTTFQLSGRYGLNLLLRVLDREVDQAEYDARTSDPASQLRWDRHFALFARAVLAGKGGQADEAMAAVAEATHVGSPYALGRHLGLRLVGEAALDDGWGMPVEWLRTAEAYFHDAGVPAVARACRGLLRRAGLRVAQRRAGMADIPSSIRSAGITLREYEVLRLLGKRFSNREIAEQLYVSRRTVETHVSSLIAKTGLPNRIALSKFASASTVGD